MNILVTGSSGLLGRELVQQLLVQGHEIYGVDISHAVVYDNHYHHSSIIDESISYDEVYCLTGFPCPATYLQIPATTMFISQQSFQSALLCAVHNKATFVVTSSSEVYEDKPTEDIMREDDIGTIDLLHPRACYKELKRYMEVCTYSAMREWSLNARIVRVFNSYGPSHLNDTRIINQLLKSVKYNKPFIIYGDGNQKRSYCYVEDTVKGILAVARSTMTTPVNIGNPNEVYSIYEVLHMVEKVSGSKIIYQHEDIPSYVGPVYRKPDISKALLLGWKPLITLEEGLTKLLSLKN